jgi:peptidoglycan/xylan/chitin deacetylase (PgdA/CDA1 family)
MIASAIELAWDGVPPSLRGPQVPARANEAQPFVVPANATGSERGFVFGRMISSDAWPEALERVDRVVAVPAPSSPDTLPGRRVLEFESAKGERRVLCSRSEGAVHWSLDPRVWIQGLLDERYVESWRRPLPSRIPVLNYARLPHWVKGLLQQGTTRDEMWANPSAAAFPFPELPLDDLVETLRELCICLAHGGPVETRSPWPEGHGAALTVTHDVDTDWVLDPRRAPMLDRILEKEAAFGMRGAWYVTGARLDPQRHRRALERLAGAGHEIGPHGWNHDAKLEYLPRRRQEARMRRIEKRFAGLAPRGIRTPWYCRSPGLFEVLGRHFAYDSSVPNASGFFSAGSNSGCCSLFPYAPGRAGTLYELPMTLPPDGFADLEAGYSSLRDIAERVIDGGGVVVVTMHPQPHQSANAEGLEHFFAFLEDLAGSAHLMDRSSAARTRLWHATPGEIVARYHFAITPPEETA